MNLDDKTRLTKITPILSFNTIQAPDLREEAPDQNWQQPLHLLWHSAELLRKSYTDNYFPRNFSKMETTLEQYRPVMDVFGDTVVKSEGRQGDDITNLRDIYESDAEARTRCADLMNAIQPEDDLS